MTHTRPSDNIIRPASAPGPIGVFDSGYGGLTILKALRERLPQYDYLYLGDNARAPYGMRSFEIVYQFTWEAVSHLFERGCHLVILGCNTASAKALRTIQRVNLPRLSEGHRVLGVIRPTVEALGEVSQTGCVGILGTPGTVKSHSYDMEIAKLYPTFRTFSQACPMLVPLVEYDEWQNEGTDYFVKKYIDSLLSQCADIDTLILGCTHYPILIEKIKKYVPDGITLLTQGELVAESLENYFVRHPELEQCCTKGGTVRYFTTESAAKFSTLAEAFLHTPVNALRVDIA